MRCFVFCFFFLFVGSPSLAQEDTLTILESIPVGIHLRRTNDMKVFPVYSDDCAHGHICCATGCSCCSELSIPNTYDTTHIVKFDKTTRYTVMEHRLWASSYEKSTIQYLFSSNTGKTMRRYYRATQNYSSYFSQNALTHGKHFENGYEIVFDDDYHYFRISESGEHLGFSFQTDEKIGTNIHRISILMNNRRLFGLTNNFGELNERGIGYRWIADPNENGHIVATQTNGIMRVFDQTGTLVFDKAYDVLEDIGGGFFKSRDKHGEFLVSQNGKKVGKSYDDVGKYSNGMIAVRKGEKYGFINAEGKLIVRPQYEWVLEFTEDRAAVSTKGDKWGFIDRSGKLVIPYRFVDVNEFDGGRASVSVKDKNHSEKWGVIDLDGNYILEPTYDEIYPFNEGFAKVHINEREKGNGIINLDGKIVIECQYGIDGYGDHTPWFVDGVLLARTYGKNAQLFLKNQKGKTVKELKEFVSGRLVQVANKMEWLPYFIVDSKNGKGMIDTQGNVLIKARFDHVYVLDDRYALTMINERLFIIDYIENETKHITGDRLKLMPSMGFFVSESKDGVPYCYNYKGELLEVY